MARAVRALSRKHPPLGAIARQYGTPALRLRRPGFATLVQIILEQQVSVASGQAVYRNLKKLAGGLRAENLVQLGESKLRTAGLSRQKARYCHSLAQVVDAGELKLAALNRLDDDGCRELLMQQPGIGRWTADIYLLVAMGRPDVWPAGDLALQVAQAEILGLKSRPGHDESDELAAQWRPWRSVAARLHWLAYRGIRAQK